MPDNSWDNGGVTRRGSHKPWLKWMLVGIGLAIGIPLLMTATIGGLALRHRAEVWPVVRTVHARLQTDEGARDLYEKNPALANVYLNDQDFLDTVRIWRSKVGDLPAQEPPEGPSYSPDADPGRAAASIQGSGGAWMMVDIRGGRLAGPTEGEGITRIFFGEDKKALRDARKKAGAFKTQREWEGFRKLMLECGEDSTAAALYRREPGLHARYPSEAAFLESMKALRPALAKLPARMPDDRHEFRINNFHSPFSHSRVLTFSDSEGQELVVTWRSDRLTDLELRPSKRPK